MQDKIARQASYSNLIDSLKGWEIGNLSGLAKANFIKLLGGQKYYRETIFFLFKKIK